MRNSEIGSGFQYLIGADELRSQLAQPNWRVVDCRFDLMQPSKGREEYGQGHIPGAQYADLDKDLAGAVTDASGRHPLPCADAFADTLGAWGVDNMSQVVAYDHAGGAIAARLWWMLRWLGHEKVAVLNGGYAAWKDAGYEESAGAESVAAARFRPEPEDDLIVSTDELQKLVASGVAPPIVDARDRARFAGRTEPIDSVAGHVPGAINFPSSECIGCGGHWKSGDELRNAWAQVLGADTDRPWIGMCGSGVTACHLALSAGMVGYAQPRLYVGSWSEWIRDPLRPVATDRTASRSPADLR